MTNFISLPSLSPFIVLVYTLRAVTSRVFSLQRTEGLSLSTHAPYTIETAHVLSHGTANLSFLSIKLHHTPPEYSSRSLAGEKHLARAKHPKALSNPYSRIYLRISFQKDIQSKSTAYSTNFTKRSIRTSGTQSQREIASASQALLKQMSTHSCIVRGLYHTQRLPSNEARRSQAMQPPTEYLIFH